MSKLEIESWEDRSGEYEERPENAFGFVYFTDGSRVGYSSGVPGDRVQAWQPRTNGSGRYQEVTARHIFMADELLQTLGIVQAEKV